MQASHAQAHAVEAGVAWQLARRHEPRNAARWALQARLRAGALSLCRCVAA
jgi:ribosomal protein S3